MLKIKLARFGKRNQPHYRIVINEARTKRDGKYVALIGHYAPTQTPKMLKIDMEAYRDWMTKGAQPTETVASLAKRFESGNPFPEKKKKLSKKAKAKLATAKEDKVSGEAKESDLSQAAEPKEAEETKTKVVVTEEEKAPAKPEVEVEVKSEEKPEAKKTPATEKAK